MQTTNIISLDEVTPHIRGVMDSTPRSQFCDDRGDDMPVDIGEGINCSKPSTIGYMMSLLKGHGSVLEIGTGCGWQTAMLSKSYEVTSAEINENLFKLASDNLKDYEVKLVNGSGFEVEGTFDNIIVCCAMLSLKPLYPKLREGGRIVAPALSGEGQSLFIADKIDGEVVVTKDKSCKFVLAI